MKLKGKVGWYSTFFFQWNDQNQHRTRLINKYCSCRHSLQPPLLCSIVFSVTRKCHVSTFLQLSKCQVSKHRVKTLRCSYLTGVLSTGAVTSTEHVFRDPAVEGLAAVAFFSGDDGELDSAEGGGDLASFRAGVSPAWHPAHSPLRYGGVVPGQQSDGHVTVQIDRGPQLERWG